MRKARIPLPQLKVTDFAVLSPCTGQKIGAWSLTVDEKKLKVNASVVFCGSRDGAEMEGMAGKWVEAMEMFKEWAKFSGCDGIEIVGRKGWSRIFKNSGFEESYVTIESEV